MKAKARTFKQIEKEKTFEQLNKFAKEVTELYANSILEYSQSNICKEQNLSRKCLRDLMDHAIIINLVTRETAEKVLEKTMQNQKRKSKQAGGTSIQHHKEIIRKREEYLLYMYSRMEVKQIATDIAINPSQPLQHFTRNYRIESDNLTKKILERAISENIVSNEIMEKIIERSMKGKTSDNANAYFEKLKQKRQQNKSSQK